MEGIQQQNKFALCMYAFIVGIMSEQTAPCATSTTPTINETGQIIGESQNQNLEASVVPEEPRPRVVITGPDRSLSDVARDPRQADMKRLVATQLEQHKTEGVTFQQLVQIARANGLFKDILTTKEGKTNKAESTAMARILTSNGDAIFPGKVRFNVLGTGHARRYALQRP